MGGTASQRETATERPEIVTLTLSFSDVIVTLDLRSLVVSESLCESSPSYDTRPTSNLYDFLSYTELSRGLLTMHG